MKRVCVFCGSRTGRNPDYVQAARELGRELAARGLGLVYGGASIGLMGAIADAALESGGEVIGVIPRSLLDQEIAHAGLTALHVVNSMHERKALMASLSDAFIAMPGGFGTFDELFEIITWRQLGLNEKNVGLLNIRRYFDPLLFSVKHACHEGFLDDSGHTFLVREEVGPLLDELRLI